MLSHSKRERVPEKIKKCIWHWKHSLQTCWLMKWLKISCVVSQSSFNLYIRVIIFKVNTHSDTKRMWIQMDLKYLKAEIDTNQPCNPALREWNWKDQQRGTEILWRIIIQTQAVQDRWSWAENWRGGQTCFYFIGQKQLGNLIHSQYCVR